MKILALNSGSSSRRAAFTTSGTFLRNIRSYQPGKIEWDGNHANIQAQNSQRTVLKDRIKVASRSGAIEQLLDTIWNFELRVASSLSEIDLVGRRILRTRKSPSPIQRFTS